MTIGQLTEFFMWMTVINFGLLIFSTIMLISLKGVTQRLHSRLFGIEESQVSAIAYDFLGRYKLLIIVFNLIPWLALLCMQ